jgi:hypothetical protein
MPTPSNGETFTYVYSLSGTPGNFIIGSGPLGSEGVTLTSNSGGTVSTNAGSDTFSVTNGGMLNSSAWTFTGNGFDPSAFAGGVIGSIVEYGQTLYYLFSDTLLQQGQQVLSGGNSAALQSYNETFHYMYAVDPSTNQIQPQSDATNVVVSDTTPGGTLSKNDDFTVSNANQWDGTYSFQYTATAGGEDGFIAKNLATGNDYFFTNSQVTGTPTPQDTGGTETICFMPGTQIRTPSGERPIESLKPDDLVLTIDHRSVPVRWIGRQTISRRFSDPLRILPIRVKAGAVAANVPSRDLLVSPDHALLIDGVLVHAGALINGTSIVRESNVPMTFTYYHVEVDDHTLILCENTPAETFIDNVDRMRFDNWDEHQSLYPDGKPITEMPYPRAKAYRQVPAAIREKLNERAALLEDMNICSAA